MADRIILSRATDSNGDIVSGAKAYFYVKGTTTPLTVYSDEAATVAVSQPLLADSEGVFAPTYTTASVKVNITDTDDVDLPGFPSDPHPKVPASSSAASNVTFDPVTGNPGTDVQDAIEVNTNLWNAVTTFGKSLIAAANAGAARVVMGLGSASPAAGAVLYSNGSNYANLGIGTAGQALKVNDGGTAPEWGALSGETAAQLLDTETAVDFTEIPSWATEIEVLFSGATLSGGDDILIQIGDSGGMETTGYDSAGALINGATTQSAQSTAGYYIRANASGRTALGPYRLTKDPGTDKWFGSGSVSLGSNVVAVGGGEKTLSDTLTQVRVTRDGSNTFDGGSVSIRWRA